jgi:CcmD family protein
MKEQPTNTSLTVEGRSQEFVPVQGAGETTSAEQILVLAYACFWLVVFAFVYLTRRKQVELEVRLDAIEKALGTSGTSR